MGKRWIPSLGGALERSHRVGLGLAGAAGPSHRVARVESEPGKPICQSNVPVAQV